MEPGSSSSSTATATTPSSSSKGGMSLSSHSTQKSHLTAWDVDETNNEDGNDGWGTGFDAPKSNGISRVPKSASSSRFG
jgi:hypothetical protein